MKYTVAFLPVALLVARISQATIDIHIVGGTDADISSFPWMAAIFYYNEAKSKSEFTCGGSIISRRVILTAAHCFASRFSTNIYFTVVVGMTDIYSRNARHIKIDKTFIHENFSSRLPYNDICIARLEEELSYSSLVQPIKLPQIADFQKDYIGEELSISGWGVLKEGGVLAESLQVTTQTVISNENCDRIYRRLLRSNFRRNLPRGITSGIICALDSTIRKSDACMKDSGGPMLFNSTIIAIVATGLKCGEGNPGIYTQVSYFLDWMQSKLRLI